MENDMLGNALRTVCGPLGDLNQKLASPEGEEWLTALKCFLRKEDPWALLKPIGTISVPARTLDFVVGQHFVVDTSEKARVKISDVWTLEKSMGWFFGKVECPKGVHELRYARLRYHSPNGPIRAKLGTGTEVFLGSVFYLMAQQPNGEDGVLATRDGVNLFFVRWAEDVLCELVVAWEDGGWDVCVDVVRHDDAGLHAGFEDTRVFSRKF